MIVSTQGTSIFGGTIHQARLIFNCDDVDTSNPCVLYAETLTNEIAIKVIKNGICGLITHESSFATHGANIIRGYCHKTGTCITWVSGVRRSEIDRFKNETVDIGNGLISSSIYTDYRANTPKNFYSQTKYVPQPSRCLVQYNTSTSDYRVCYWPHRSYDPFTFSIMETGLKLNYALCFNRDVQITLDKMGHIWFENGLLLRELIEKANNIEVGNAFLEQQMACYDEICCILRRREVSPEAIIQLLIKYFSVFLLFHNTYEHVFQKAYQDFSAVLPEEMVAEFLDFLMFCEIDEWMLNLGYPLEKNKDLFSAEPVTPIPELCIYADTAHKQQAVQEWFVQHDFSKQYFEKQKQIAYWVNVFVVKEWKFLVNKLLFTRMSAIMRRFPEEVVCVTKQQTYLQFLKKESMDSDRTNYHI